MLPTIQYNTNESSKCRYDVTNLKQVENNKVKGIVLLFIQTKLAINQSICTYIQI